MFKAQILRRSFSLFRKVPNSTIVRSALRDGHETVHIQRVRFKRRFFTRSRFYGTLVAAGGAYGFLQWLDEEVEEEEEVEPKVHRIRRRRTEEEGTDNESGEIDDEEEDDEDEGDGLIFFPTGFSRPSPKTFYSGSDPEWEEFVRISQDRQRLNRIRAEFIAMTRHIASKNASYKLRLGKINTNAGSVWVEVRFPDGPPTEFERPGIELTEDLTFRKTTRPVHEIHHWRLSQALVPTAVANSLYMDSMRKINKSWQDAKKYLGWEDKHKPDTAQKILREVSTPSPSTPKSPAPSATSASSSTPLPAPSSTERTQNQSTSPTSSSDPASNPAYERLGLALPDPSKAPTTDLSYFRRLFRMQHKHIFPQPPRGCFVVSGLIEIIGDKAKMTLDVAAAYDPKIGRYVMLRARIRSVTDYTQRPRGGS